MVGSAVRDQWQRILQLKKSVKPSPPPPNPTIVLNKRSKGPALKMWKRTSATSADIARTVLVALRESADAFPPLKAVAGAALAVWDIAEVSQANIAHWNMRLTLFVAKRVTTSKKKARALALRAKEILELLFDTIPDPHDIPIELLARIVKFTTLLEEVATTMEPITKRSGLSTFVHLHQHEEGFADFTRRLDEAHKDFIVENSSFRISRLSDIVVL
ncbi:hypothetical protein DXG01_013992 [Tephrocybe rancida]|nr:hypothetical protein DXG01_013992 [Tephrocybe rancida]